jgi:sugar lactone lactonase YvrE
MGPAPPADLSHISPYGWSEITVDGRGSIYINTINFDSAEFLIVAESFARRLTAFDITADGTLSNRRVGADATGDGICLDAEGAVWCSDVGPDEAGVCLRVREGGEVLDRIELDRPCYACMLGGQDGRTLFMIVARWPGPDRIDELVQAKTGQVLINQPRGYTTCQLALRTGDPGPHKAG